MAGPGPGRVARLCRESTEKGHPGLRILRRLGPPQARHGGRLLRGGDGDPGPGATRLGGERRSAAGKTLPLLAAVTLDDILKERGFELYWEGLRRQDLVRFGKYTEAWQEKPVTDATKTLFPLPTSAVDVNENLTQNPGY